jgi:hypothetical protein
LRLPAPEQSPIGRNLTKPAPIEPCDSATEFLLIGPEMPLTNYTLDTFVAPKLSLLTECGAREIPTFTNSLNVFILNSAFITGKLPDKYQAYTFNFIRRAEGALLAYREARNALIEYLATPRDVLSPYFRALLYFEVCLSQCYQGYMLLREAWDKKNFFEKDDNSAAERLEKLYADFRHMEVRIKDGDILAEATVAVWITNQGLESCRATLSFDELTEILVHMEKLAEGLSTRNPAN